MKPASRIISPFGPSKNQLRRELREQQELLEEVAMKERAIWGILGVLCDAAGGTLTITQAQIGDFLEKTGGRDVTVLAFPEEDGRPSRVVVAMPPPQAPAEGEEPSPEAEDPDVD